MFNGKAPIGITKFINYSDSSPQRAEKFSRYLQNLSKTNSEYVTVNYLDRNNVERGIQVIEQKWKPRGSRSFKQGILAYGVTTSEYPIEKIVKFNEELLKKMYPHNPWLVAVHTNKPLLHAHFLLVTTNVITGKKMSQSPKDLKNFKDQYDELARKYGLPNLNQRNLGLIEETQVQRTVNQDVLEPEIIVSIPSYSTVNEVFYHSDYFPYNGATVSTTNGQSVQNVIQKYFAPITEILQRNTSLWYELGKQRRFS